MFMVAVFAGAVLASTAPSVSPADLAVESVDVGYAELAGGKPEAAIARINAGSAAQNADPVALINLAAANARLGRTAEARRLLVAAQAGADRYDVQLADGTWLDSRQAARIALGRLDSAQVLARR